MPHVHVHLHNGKVTQDAKDAGTSEGARKAALTRKQHGGGGKGVLKGAVKSDPHEYHTSKGIEHGKRLVQLHKNNPEKLREIYKQKVHAAKVAEQSAANAGPRGTVGLNRKREAAFHMGGARTIQNHLNKNK